MMIYFTEPETQKSIYALSEIIHEDDKRIILAIHTNKMKIEWIKAINTVSIDCIDLGDKEAVKVFDRTPSFMTKGSDMHGTYILEFILEYDL